MEKRLSESAVIGTVVRLLELALRAWFAESPLHIACRIGHVDMVREILSRNPELVFELNSQGSSPLHLAAAEGHVEIVRDLLKINAEVCLLRHQNSRALYATAIKDPFELPCELFQVVSIPRRGLAIKGETALHLCVKHNQFEAIKSLVQRSVDNGYLKIKDNDGNSALHPAIAERNIQMIKLLDNNPGLDVNAMGDNGATFLDASVQSPPQLSPAAEAMTSRNLSGSTPHQILSNHEIASLVKSPALPQQQCGRYKEKKLMKTVGDWLEECANLLVTAAMLITSVTFQAAITPPGGDYAKLNDNSTFHIRTHYGRNVTMYSYTIDHNDTFMLIDTSGFLSSLSIIVIIISGFHLQHRLVVWVLMLMMATAFASVIGIFSVYLSQPNAEDVTRLCLGLFPLAVVLSSIPPGKWLLKKFGIIGKGERNKEGGDDVIN